MKKVLLCIWKKIGGFIHYEMRNESEKMTTSTYKWNDFKGPQSINDRILSIERQLYYITIIPVFTLPYISLKKFTVLAGRFCSICSILILGNSDSHLFLFFQFFQEGKHIYISKLSIQNFTKRDKKNINMRGCRGRER